MDAYIFRPSPALPEKESHISNWNWLFITFIYRIEKISFSIDAYWMFGVLCAGKLFPSLISLFEKLKNHSLSRQHKYTDTISKRRRHTFRTLENGLHVLVSTMLSSVSRILQFFICQTWCTEQSVYTFVQCTYVRTYVQGSVEHVWLFRENCKLSHICVWTFCHFSLQFTHFDCCFGFVYVSNF